MPFESLPLQPPAANHPPPVADKQAIARAFSRSAGEYDRVARLQQATGEQLLTTIETTPRQRVVDLGTGTGQFLPALASQGQQLLALDLACGMLRYARSKRAVPAVYLAADAEHLPLAPASVDLLFSNLALQWTDLGRVLSQAAQILKPGGSLHFTTLLADTLHELRDSWATLDSDRHVNRFDSRAELTQILAACPLRCRSLHYRLHRLHYQSALHLMRELKGVGATHVPGRQNRVLSRATLAQLERCYRQRYAEGASLPASWEVAYIVLEKSR